MPQIATFLHPITSKYNALGGANAPLNPPTVTLGNPTTEISIAPDGEGAYQHYERGSIYWSARAGAQAQLIYGRIRERWGQLTWEQGRLGYPTSDELDGPQGPPQRMNAFEGGAIVWDPQRGAQERVPATVPVFAQIVQALTRLGIKFGYAVSADAPVAGRLRHFQRFKENLSRIYNSMEMHLDGTVYLSYTPVKHPPWYDVYNAVDDTSLPPIRTASGLQKLRDARLKNVDVGTWDVPYRAGISPAPRWLTIRPPEYRVPQATPSLNDCSSFCDREAFGWGPFGPPEWETILPENEGGFDFGQRTVIPGEPESAPGNRYIYWSEVYDLMQRNPNLGHDILRYRGRPDGSAHSDNPIPWTPAVAEGVVVNSFLSGDDYGGTHLWPPPDYWQGNREPRYNQADGEYPDNGPTAGHVKLNAACDWDIHVKPDLDYHFLLGSKGLFTSEIEGNFSRGLQGSLECEIEQWMTPSEYRPEIGDRIYVTGRWVIDCADGDDPDYHAELHPYELIVTSRTRPSPQPDAIGGIETVAYVSINGAWAGGILQFNVWPPPRPIPEAKLRGDVHTDQTQGLTVVHTLFPEVQPPARDLGTANHLSFQVNSTQPRGTLYSGGDNDVTYIVTRRLAAIVRVWWVPSHTHADPSASA